MRLVCTWQQRQLTQRMVRGEAIHPESRLGRHLARCKECADARHELVSLQSDMGGFVPPALSAHFDTRLQARLQSELQAGVEADLNPARHGLSLLLSHSRLPATLGVALAGTVSALTLWFLWANPSLSNRVQAFSDDAPPTVLAEPVKPAKNSKLAEEQTANKTRFFAFGKNPSPRVRKRSRSASLARVERLDGSKRGSKRTPNARYFRLSEQSKNRRRLAGHVPHRKQGFRAPFQEVFVYETHRHARRQHVVLPTTTPVTVLNLSVTENALPLRVLGEMYATCGDYSRASEAYGQAYEDQQQAELALSAGANAERAGDHGMSLEYIARALTVQPVSNSAPPADKSMKSSDTKGNPE